MTAVLVALSVLTFAGVVGFVAALTVPRERRGSWLGVTVAMATAGIVGFFVALSFVFG